MSAGQLTAGTVMDGAAALVNDAARTVYTYPIQIPYLRIAMQELQEYFALHSLPVTQKKSTIIVVPIGTDELGYDTVPKLPDDLIEIEELWQRDNGVNFTSVIRNNYIWEEQKLKFHSPLTIATDLKIDYIRQLFTDVQSQDSVINIVNAKTFLEFRTAGLLAEFVIHDDPTAQKMNGYASLGMDRATGISVKGKQSISVRRRPFRSNYKRNHSDL